MEARSRGEACVLVLGDFGRSPRMQYHSLSLVEYGFNVNVVAYGETEPHEDVRKNESIKLNYMRNVPKFEKYLPRMLAYIMKTIWQSLFLLIALLQIPSPKLLLLQNPPSIPTLPVACFACWMRNCRLVIDFHNYGYTLLGMTIGSGHILVKICKWCEKYFGQKADGCLCVSEAMQEDLAKNWNIRSTAFYDCPPDIFHPISLAETHALFMKLSQSYKSFASLSNDDSESTRFTTFSGSQHSLLANRPPLLVSSTSWTEDEDFSILLNALEEYELAALKSDNLRSVVVAITGKGPMKSYYEKIIEEKAFTRVEIITIWLDAEDYPKFLASADLGICLHKSSSNLDLPMKVVDMFGSGLPVCAVKYLCVSELVNEGYNGLLFSSSHGLAEQLQRLLRHFPDGTELWKYRQFLLDFPPIQWDESWHHSVRPLLEVI